MYPYTKQIEPTATAEGEFSDGNPQLNQSRTILRSYWPNMVQRELLAILQAAGITPEQENYAQVKQAIQALINSGDASVLQSAITQDNALNTSLRSYIDAQVASAISQANAYTNQSFIGQITAGPYATIPNGWLALEGGTFRTSLYPKLYEYINNYYGFSNIGPGNFNKVGNTIYLPDMRGLFVRGYGGKSSQLGFLQGDAIRNITGGFTVGAQYESRSGLVAVEGTGAFNTQGAGTGGKTGKIDNNKGNVNGQRITFSASKAGVPTSSENRPVNVAWRYIIRAI